MTVGSNAHIQVSSCSQDQCAHMSEVLNEYASAHHHVCNIPTQLQYFRRAHHQRCNAPVCLTSILPPGFMYPFWRTFSSSTIFTLLCHSNNLPFSFLPNFLTHILLSIPKSSINHACQFLLPCQFVADFVSHTRSRVLFPSTPSLHDEMSNFTSFTSCFSLRKSEAPLRLASYLCAWHVLHSRKTSKTLVIASCMTILNMQD